MKTLDALNFRGQNWLISPAALSVDEPRPDSIYDQEWLVVLAGVVEADVKGNSTHQWLHETLSFMPDLDSPLKFAIDRYSIPRPGNSTGAVFVADQWAPFVSLSSVFDQDSSDNAGFAVDVWRPTPFVTVVNVVTGQNVNNGFAGVDVDVAVRDTDAWIYRIGYNITLLGRIVFVNNSPL